MLWFLIGWIVCGILAYGLTKNDFKAIDEEFYQKYNDIPLRYELIDEIWCCAIGITGYFGFITMLIHCANVRGLGLCFRMPKKFCKK